MSKEEGIAIEITRLYIFFVVVLFLFFWPILCFRIIQQFSLKF